MKTIDMKSLIIGMLITGMSIALMSNSPQEKTSTLTLSNSPNGIIIYNEDTRQLFKYDIHMGNISVSPGKTYVVSPDGSSLSKK
ncbi:MAG: hypothetical protein WED10_08890 [Brumimicrobium sp.]